MFVFDASTLILIAKIELLEVFLGSISMEVAVPRAVERECCGGKKTLDGLMIRKAMNEERIRVLSTESRLAGQLQQDFSLGRGEAEAIVLALQEKSRIIGVDDKNAINACKLLGVSFTTAVSILLRIREKGLIDGAQALNRLSALAKYGRYRKAIVEDARLRLEEMQ
jgi:predicted nucleic acid-binding protein